MASNAQTLWKIINNNPRTSFSHFSLQPLDATTISCCDASGPDGAGAWSWETESGSFKALHQPWPKGWSSADDFTSSTLQELATILLTVTIHNSKRHLIFTDSIAAVHILARGWSPNVTINKTLAAIFTACTHFDSVLTLVWHRRDSSPGALAADSLSHANLQDASRYIPQLNHVKLNQITSNHFPFLTNTTPTSNDHIL